MLAYDASPGLGGALTSLEALAEVVSEAGGRMLVVSTSSAARTLRLEVTDELESSTEWSGRRYLFSELRRARALGQIIRSRRPNVLLLNNTPGANLAGALAATAAGVPYVQYVRAPIRRGRVQAAVLSAARGVLSVGREAWSTAGGLMVDEGIARWPRSRDDRFRAFFYASAHTPWKGLPLVRQAWTRAGRPAPLVMALAAIHPGRPPPGTRSR